MHYLTIYHVVHPTTPLPNETHFASNTKEFGGYEFPSQSADNGVHCCLPGCTGKSAKPGGSSQTFGRNIPLPSSGSRSKLSKKRTRSRHQVKPPCSSILKKKKGETNLRNVRELVLDWAALYPEYHSLRFACFQYNEWYLCPRYRVRSLNPPPKMNLRDLWSAWRRMWSSCEYNDVSNYVPHLPPLHPRTYIIYSEVWGAEAVTARYRLATYPLTWSSSVGWHPRASGMRDRVH
jgi:hypothetical protein